MTAPGSRPSRARLAAALLTVLALAAIAASIATVPAQALPASGTVEVTAKKRQSTLRVVALRAQRATTLRTRGVLRLPLAGRVAKLRRVTVRIAGRRALIRARLGKRRPSSFFFARGPIRIDGTGVELGNARLALTRRGARVLRAAFGLGGLRAGRVGRIAIDAALRAPALEPTAPEVDPPAAEKTGDPDEETPAPLVDPYAAECALDVESRVDGAAAGPAAAPDLSGATDLTGGAVEWGLSGDLRFYVVVISNGSLVPIAPAEVLNPPEPAPQIGSFRFPAGAGAYAVGTPEDSGDDRAIVEGEGEVVLCNAPHGFRITLSNPAVTIDGAESRLTVDVDTNISGVHTPSQRVDLATLDVEGVEPFYDEDARTVTWTGLPATLTEAGAEALQLCNPAAPGPCDYEAGDPIDPVTVSVSTETAVDWPFAAACTVASPATASSWPPAPPAPLAAPELDSPEAVSGGEISWGVRNSLRATVQANGAFNLSGGATRSDPTDMSGAGKSFSWPASEGEYERTGERLVLHGAGTVGLCNTTHGYGTVLSDPTLTIDSEAARLTMTVSTRLGVSWTSGRVDVADLDLAGAETSSAAGPEAGEETLTWAFPDPGADETPGGGDDDTDSANSTVTLAAPGTSALWLLGGSYRSEGTPLNKVVVSAVVPSE